MTEATWRPVAGAPGYEVSDSGLVRGPSGRVLKPWRIESPRDRRRVYLKVGLFVGSARLRRFVHRLVCEAFHGAPFDGADCAHLNHDSLDNRAANLAWQSHSENITTTYGEEARERRALVEEGCGFMTDYDLTFPPENEDAGSSGAADLSIDGAA